LGAKAPPTQQQVAPADNRAEIAAANAAATQQNSKLQADRDIAEQRANLTIGARGKRGLLAYLNPDRQLSSTLG